CACAHCLYQPRRRKEPAQAGDAFSRQRYYRGPYRRQPGSLSRQDDAGGRQGTLSAHLQLTHLDIGRSRSFGVVTRNREVVQEAARLFEADTKRQEFTSRNGKLVVSPVNARKTLAAFLKGAKKELLIYDVDIADREMLRILEGRVQAGVKVKIIGHVSRSRHLSARSLRRMRLHTRVIIRDSKQAFLGSQSMRKLELDARREIGIIVSSP